jgi:hypothetical protein
MWYLQVITVIHFMLVNREKIAIFQAVTNSGQSSDGWLLLCQ